MIQVGCLLAGLLPGVILLALGFGIGFEVRKRREG